MVSASLLPPVMGKSSLSSAMHCMLKGASNSRVAAPVGKDNQPTTTVPDVSQFPLKDSCHDTWTWSFQEKSHEVRLYGPRHETAHFHPNWSNGTAAVRGTSPLNYGRHYWEVKVSQRIFGTSMMFGVCTSKQRLHVDAFVNLIGEDAQGWGLSHKGMLWHDGKWRQFTKPFRENEATTVGLLFDWHAGTLTIYKDGENLGVAFTGMNQIEEEIFPVICSTAAKTEMGLGPRLRGFTSLQDRCRATIVASIRHPVYLDYLPLPTRMIQYIQEAAL